MHVTYTYTPSKYNCFLSGRQFGCVPALIIIDICIHCPPPDPFSVTCTLSTPLFPLNLPSHACTYTHTHTRTCIRTHHCCLAFTHLFKTGSTVGNMLVTYVACLLSLSEKLFVCGWASAYVSPMTIRSGLLWCCWWGVGWGGVGDTSGWSREGVEEERWGVDCVGRRLP